MNKPIDQYIQALEKIKTEFWELYGWEHCKEEIDLLQELVDEKYNNPTEEEVMKEFEELGYRIHTIENYNICLFKYYKQYNEDYSITIDLKNKCYYCDDMDVVIDMKTHQLLTKLFKAWGWFDE